MTILQELNSFKVMEYCSLTDREFKLAVMKKLNKLQENKKEVQWVQE